MQKDISNEDFSGCFVFVFIFISSLCVLLWTDLISGYSLFCERINEKDCTGAVAVSLEIKYFLFCFVRIL